MHAIGVPDLQMALRQNQIITASELLDERGNLVQKGYATRPMLRYDKKRVALPWRLKEWDYYLVMDGDFGLALTVADNYYVGLASVSVLDFQEARERTQSFMRAMPMGAMNLPASSATGNVTVSSLCSKKYNFKFTVNKKSRTLSCHVANFASNQDLTARITLTDEPDDSMVIATPFRTGSHFYYNQKIVGFCASGDVFLGNKRLHHFGQNTAQALLDWGRGVWEYESTWLWSAGMFRSSGHRIGFNLGGGFGDTSAATENMVFVDGRASKLDQIRFRIPKRADGSDDFMAEWTISSSDGRFECKFRPLLNRKARTSIKILLSDQNQVFGFATGYLVADGGKKYTFKDKLVFAEKVHNRW